MRKLAVLSVLLTLGLLLLAGCGATTQSELGPTATLNPTGTPKPSPTAWAIPFEGVVQILAMYYDQGGDLQVGWTGSGTIISSSGLVLTNAHVVLSDPYYQVDELVVALTVSEDSEPVWSYFAEVLQADEALDIAVIQITHDLDGNPVAGDLGLPFVPLGDSDLLSLGDPVTILGYPGIGGINITLTSGQVSGFTSELGRDDPRAFVKTDATIAGGNSGGLAADANGLLIGIPTQLGYGGEDQFIDCRVLADTNRDGTVNDLDNCVPTGGFINALRPIKLALPLIEAAQRGEVNIVRIQEPVEEVSAPVMGEVLFFDDFSQSTSGFTESYSDDDLAVYYLGGEYYIDVYVDGLYTWEVYPDTYEDSAVTVDARFASPAQDGDAALICRYLDNQNFYIFRISEDGYYSIGKVENDEFVFLTDWQYSDFVAQNVAKGFYMTATCSGTELSLSMNGQLLNQTEDSSFTTGRAGISAGTYANPGLSVAFDNFEVSSLLSGLPSGGEILASTDFSSPEDGFDEVSTQDYATYYAGGEYVFEIHIPDYLVWNWYTDEYSSVVLSADVRFIEMAYDGEASLLCRMGSDGSFYRFVISADGYFAAELYDGQQWLSLLDWQYSDYILENAGAFSISLVCSGNRLVMGMNDRVLGQVTDYSLASGGNGFGVGTFTTGGVVLAFDNFEVRQAD